MATTGVVVQYKTKLDSSVKKSFKKLKANFKTIGNMASKALNIGKYVAAGGAVAGVALLALINKSANAGDAIDKMSKRIGTSAEFTAQLAHAANLGGTSIENMETGIRRLQRSAFDAAKGSKNAQMAFDMLGVSVSDNNGRLKTTEQLFSETAEGLTKIENNSEKAALASMLFGRAGTSLLPMLSEGSRGLKTAMQDYQELSGVWNNETSTSAANVVDAFTRIKLIVTGLAERFSISLFPTVLKITESLKEFYLTNKKLIDEKITEWGGKLGKGIQWVIEKIGKAITFWKDFYKEVSNTGAIQKFIGSISSAIDTLWNNWLPKGYEFAKNLAVIISDQIKILMDQWKDIFMQIGKTALGRQLGLGDYANKRQEQYDTTQQNAKGLIDRGGTQLLNQIGGTKYHELNSIASGTSTAGLSEQKQLLEAIKNRGKNTGKEIASAVDNTVKSYEQGMRNNVAELNKQQVNALNLIF